MYAGRRNIKSKYDTRFGYYLKGRTAKLYEVHPSKNMLQERDLIPLTKTYRKRTYLLDPSILPHRIRWIDITKSERSLDSLEREAELLLRVIIKSFLLDGKRSVPRGVAFGVVPMFACAG